MLRDDPHHAEPAAVLLADLEAYARRRAEELVGKSARLATMLVAGYKPVEARRELELSVTEYEVARGWIRAALVERR